MQKLRTLVHPNFEEINLSTARRLAGLAAFAALLSALLTGCGSSTPATTTAASGTFTNVYQTILNPACVQCHAPGKTATANGVNLDFSSQTNAYATLFSNGAPATVVGSGETAACKGIPIASSGNLNASYIVAITIASYNNTTNFDGKGCTPDQVHIQSYGAGLDADQATSLTAWITAGVPNN